MRVLVIGAGRVGAPLAAWLANHHSAVEYVGVAEIDVDTRNSFIGASFDWEEPELNYWITEGMKKKKLGIEDDISNKEYNCAFICVGTPVVAGMPQTDHIRKIALKLHKDVVPILRSTVPPGFTNKLSMAIERPVIHAPERLLLGHGMHELNQLPQIIGISFQETSTRSAHQHYIEETRHMAKWLGSLFTHHVMGSSTEAELAKVYNNTIRYVEFAIGTELAEGAGELGADWRVVRRMMTEGYKRGRMAFPSFVSSYCLTKDWQMLTYARTPSSLAKAAHQYNVGLFDRLVDKNNLKISGKSIAILGLTYKPGLDDVRDSMTFELLEWLELRNPKNVMIHDPLVDPDDHLPEYDDMIVTTWHVPDAMVENADIIFVMTAHKEYADITVPPGKIVIDPACCVGVDGRDITFVRRS